VDKIPASDFGHNQAVDAVYFLHHSGAYFRTGEYFSAKDLVLSPVSCQHVFGIVRGRQRTFWQC
jgi:hypothetical protein